MRKSILVSAFLLTILGCKEDKKQAFTINHSGAPGMGWINTGTLMKDETSTVNFASYIDSLNPYSIGYKQSLSDLSSTELDSLSLSVKLLPRLEKTEVTIVFAIDSLDKTVWWEGMKLNSSKLPVNLWTTMTHKVAFPAGRYDGKKILTAYVWRTSGACYVDDFKLTGTLK